MIRTIFQRVAAFFMAVLAFFGLAPKQPTPQPPADTDGYVIVERGVQFYFDANATTGYAWTADVDGNSLTLEKEYYTAPKSTGLVGQGGTQYYVFRAVQAGETTLTFTYARSWEPDTPARIYTAVVVVEEDLSVKVTQFYAQQ